MKNNGVEEVLASIIEDLDYSVQWKAKAIRAGKHRSGVSGSGFEFKTVVPITEAEDWRRIDFMSSSRAMDGIPRVKVFDQKSGIKVVLVADLSASLSYCGFVSKQREMAKMACVLGYSAYRTGDSFGFVGYGEKIEFCQPPTFSKEAGFEIGRTLWDYKMEAGGHGGLSGVIDYLPKERSLVFWFSDFYLSEREMEEFLAATENHDVRAVAFLDDSEVNLPRFGFARLRDPESGGERFVFVRPSLRRKLAAEYRQRKSRLASLFGRRGKNAYFNVGEADIKGFQNWLLENK